jgi:hypothetical protein
MQRGLGRYKLQWYESFFIINVTAIRPNRLPLVCKTDNACIGFPLAGGIHTDMLDENVANMTCYTGGETVFSNHQMCDITSTPSECIDRPYTNLGRPQDLGHAS